MSNQVQTYKTPFHAGLLLWLEWVLASIAGFSLGGNNIVWRQP